MAEISSSAACAIQSMAIDCITAEVTRALAGERVDVILLKGPSIARWLYRDGERGYGDTDLLVAPADLDRAEHCLRALGFRQVTGGRAEHAHTHVRTEDGVSTWVDLHRGLPYVTVDGDDAWRELGRGRETMVVAGAPVAVLGVAQRAFHVAIHSLQHAFESTGPLEDLRRAVAVLPTETWADAAEVSRNLGAEDAFAAGLSLLGDGREVAKGIGLTSSRRDIVRIAAAGDDEAAHAYRLARILDADSGRERLTLLADSLFVTPAVVRRSSGVARRGRVGLACAYAARPFVMTAQLIPAVVKRRRLLRQP